MSRYAAIASGKLSDTAATWAKCGYQSTFHASSVTTDILGTFLDSDTFTAPSLADVAVGAIFYITSNNQSSSVYTLTLQELVLGVWTDRASGTGTINGYVNSYNRIMLTAPYTYTTLTANAYRYTLVRTSGSGTLMRLRARSTATKWGVITLDTTTTAPTDGDNIMVISRDNGATAVDVTWDGTRTIGSFGSTTRSADPTIQDQAILIDGSSSLSADTVASCQLTCKGNVVMNGGYFNIGSSGTPYPSAQTAKWLFNENGTTQNYDIYTLGVAAYPAYMSLYGAAPSGYSANYVSGVGTAASPFITDGDIGVVGDEVCFPGSGAYNQTEYKFIKTKNSSTSYVLSATSGGAESALTYIHAKAANMTRNIKFESTDSTKGWGMQLNNNQSSVSITNMQNVQFKHVGGTGNGTQISFGYNNGAATVIVNKLSGLVFSDAIGQNIYLAIPTGSTGEWNDNLFCRNQASNNSAHVEWKASNQVTRRWIVTDTVRNAFNYSDGYNNSHYDFRISAANSSNTTNASGLSYSGSSGSNTWYNLSVQSCRQQGMYVNGSLSATLFDSSDMGTLGTNTIDLNFPSALLVNMVFRSSTFSSATLVSGVTNLFTGSRIGFHRYQNVDRTHRTYAPNVNFQSTGSSLTDTTADTTFDADSLAFRLEPLNTSTYGQYSFSMPQRAGNTIIFSGKIRKTAAFNGDAKVELFLDGASVATSTYVLSGANDTWIPFVLTADYTAGTIDRNATIMVSVRGNAGYVFLDTFFNASKSANPIGSLDLWQDGAPNSYLVSTIASASEIAGAVWADIVSYSSGSKGSSLVNAADDADTAANK